MIVFGYRSPNSNGEERTNYMISKSLALKVLNECLATGGDYAEVYVEETTNQSVELENGKVNSSSESKSYGVGIRILNGFKSVYGYTSDTTQSSLMNLAHSLATSYNGARTITVEKIAKKRVNNINRIDDHLIDVPVEEKIAYLKECTEAAQAVDQRIVRVVANFSNSHREWELFNAEGPVGNQINNTEERGRMFLLAMAVGEGGKIETGTTRPGRYDGWHWFKEIDYKGKSRRAAEIAIQSLTADECPSGVYPVVITNGWGGVLFHEACGHPLESSATSKKQSVFSESIGKQIASKLVSAYDDGTLPNEWGSNNIDSEGVKTRKNCLIKDGICKGFMVDRLNGRRLGMEPNGTCRRESYKYEPTSRMSNTYIAAGKDDPEQIIKDTKLGIYVNDFGGGSVNPMTGEFNFSASEAYIIRDGKICEPVRGCTLIGSGSEVLMNIDRVGNDVDLGQGNCGAASGSVPVNVGQPTLRISAMTVGGRGGKLE